MGKVLHEVLGDHYALCRRPAIPVVGMGEKDLPVPTRASAPQISDAAATQSHL
jgi:hypothetical protein